MHSAEFCALSDHTNPLEPGLGRASSSSDHSADFEKTSGLAVGGRAVGWIMLDTLRKGQEHECTFDAQTRANATTLKSIAEEDPLCGQMSRWKAV